MYHDILVTYYVHLLIAFDPAKAMLSIGTGGTKDECALNEDDEMNNCEG